jgi:hypothetical protein
MAWRRFSLKRLRLARSPVYGFGERVLGTSRQAPFRSPLQQCPPVAPRLGRYAADVQFKMVRCAFDRDQLVLEHAARVIHLLQAAVDFEMQGLRGVGSGPSMREVVIFREHDRRPEPLAASLCAPGRKQPVRFPCAHRYETGSATEA